MAIRLIHTADWHIAKSFGRFDAERAPMLRAARAAIVDRVGELARSVGAEAVLVAGDVFDHDQVGNDVLRKLAARLALYGDVEWHFLPGNHDRAVANGIWQRFAGIAPMDHVRIHHEAGVHRLAAGIDLLTAPLHARAISHDPTAWMDHRQSLAGTTRIGLAHGSVRGFGSSGEASVPLAADRAVTAGLDYLALGDWHGCREAGPKAWYSGTPEPDRFLDNDPGYALSVMIEGAGAAPEVERHRIAAYDWRQHVLDGDLIAGLEAIDADLTSGAGDAANMLLRVQLEGSVGIDDELNLRDRVERLADLAFWAEADFSRLRIDAGDMAADGFDDPLLADVGRRLAASMKAEGEAGAVAHRALIMLAGFVRENFVRDQGGRA